MIDAHLKTLGGLSVHFEKENRSDRMEGQTHLRVLSSDHMVCEDQEYQHESY